jgi:rare lipoprotein A (peptidoglycan hydrolase)
MTMTGIAMAAGATGSATDAPAGDSDVKLHVKKHARAGNSVRISGKVTPAERRSVTIKVDGKRIETLQADGNGKFSLRWNASKSGIYTVKAIAQSNERAVSGGSDGEKLNVYRPAAASYYGPGLYGNATACGGRLSPSTVGVAHKTLPCGTKVTLRYRGRTVTVPVIDRGPYAGNREYDLTAATKAKLRFGSTGNVLTTR